MITLKIETPSPKEVVVNILPSIWHIIKFLGLFIASLLLIYVILDQFIDMRFLGLRDAFYSLFFKPKPKPEAIPKQILDNKLFTDTIINGIKIKSVKPLTIDKIIFYGENGTAIHTLTEINTLSTLQPTPTPTPSPIPIKPKLEAEYRSKFLDNTNKIKNLQGIKMVKIYTCSSTDIGTCKNCSSKNCGKETDKGQIKKIVDSTTGETYDIILRGNETDKNAQLVYVPPEPTGNVAYKNPYASFSDCVTDKCSKDANTKCAKCLDDFDYTEITLQYEDKDILRFEIQQLDFEHELRIDAYFKLENLENLNNIWIIVGIVVGVLLLLGVFAFLYFRKTKSSEIPSEPITIKITPPQKDILVQDSSKLTVPSS